jgi:hypothetical protein
MHYDNFLADLATTPAYVFLIFLVLLAIFHLVLVRLSAHDDVFWKKVDYVWLGAAAIGLFTASAQVNRTLAQSYLESGEATRTVAMYDLLRHFLDGPFWVCMPRQRTEFSPADFDQIVREQQDLCKKATDLASRMPKVLPVDYPTLESMGYERIGETAKYEPEFGKMIEHWAQLYREQQGRYKAFLAASKQGGWELAISLIGPLLLAFALALRITKVSGEIKNAKAKAAA